MARRDGARLVAGTFVAQPNTVRTGLALTGAFRDGGLPVRDATAAAFSVFYYILGYTIEEQSRAAPDSSERWDAYREQAGTMSPAEVAAAVTDILDSGTFDYGIEALVAGVRRTH